MISRILQQVRYYSTLTLLYGVTIIAGVYIFQPTVLRPILGQQRAEATGTTAAAVVTAPETTLRKTISGRPVRIVIDTLGRDLPIDEGVHDPSNGSWTLSDTRAQFALPSQPANDRAGMTLIYGHNNRNVFAPLYRLRSGDQAEVYTHNGYVFRYQYQSYDMVTPDNVSVFTYQGKPRLTLQTCSGNWDGLRRLHHFSLIEVQKHT